MKKLSFVFLFFILFSSFNIYVPLKLSNNEQPVYDYDYNNRFSYNSDYQHYKPNHHTQFDFDSLSIPIKRAGNLILIETVIDGQRGNLIFDSGSVSELVLNKTYFREYKKRGNKSITGVNGTSQKIDIIEVDSIVISEMVFEEKYVDLVNLSQIENRIGQKILGFFGLQLIKNFEIIIDIHNNELQLFKLNRKGNRINSDDDNEKYDFTQDIEIHNNVLFIWAKVAGKKHRFCFDTAAEKNIMSHILRKKIISTISITGRVKLIGAGSSRKEVLFGKMNDFMLGEKQIKNMETLIADISALNKIYGTFISGVIGYELLSKGKFSINISKKQFGIIYNKKK